jgi:hypothetical protein
MANVDAGAYAIVAKTILSTSYGESDYTAVCTLFAQGAAVDSSEFVLGYLKYNASMAATHVFGATGSIQLRCRSNYATDARLTKIVAIKVDTVSREAVSG